MSTVVFSLMLLSMVFAGDLGLYSSLTASGTTMGGLRIDTGVIAGEATCVDVSMSSTSGSSTYWIDAYMGYYGIAISGGDNVVATTSLMFAVEKSIADGVALGVAFPIVSKTGSGDPTYIGSFDIYAVLMF